MKTTNEIKEINIHIDSFTINQKLANKKWFSEEEIREAVRNNMFECNLYAVKKTELLKELFGDI